jgi:hypothetical protein
MSDLHSSLKAEAIMLAYYLATTVFPLALMGAILTVMRSIGRR